MSLTKTSNPFFAGLFAGIGAALATSTALRTQPKVTLPQDDVLHYDNGEYITLYYLSWDDEGPEIEIIGYEQDGKAISAEELSREFVLVDAFDLAQIVIADRHADAIDRAIDRAQDERDSR